MTTVRAYTGDQNLVDGPTGTIAVYAVLPSISCPRRPLRVPGPDGSIVDFVAVLGREVTVDEGNGAFRASASAGRPEAVLDESDQSIVSSNVVGSRASCIFDAPLTMALGNLVKVFGWYDNEFGYACRLVDLAGVVGGHAR